MSLEELNDTYEEEVRGASQAETSRAWQKFLLGKYKLDGDVRIFRYIQDNAKKNAVQNVQDFYAGNITVKQFFENILSGTGEQYRQDLTPIATIPDNAVWQELARRCSLETLKAIDMAAGLKPKALSKKEIKGICKNRALIWYKWVDSVHTLAGISKARHGTMYGGDEEYDSANAVDQDVYVLTPLEKIKYEAMV